MQYQLWRIKGGGPLGHGPPLPKIFFFHHRKKLENLVWPPFVWALVASKNLAPLSGLDLLGGGVVSMDTDLPSWIPTDHPTQPPTYPPTWLSISTYEYLKYYKYYTPFPQILPCRLPCSLCSIAYFSPPFRWIVNYCVIFGLFSVLFGPFSVLFGV